MSTGSVREPHEAARTSANVNRRRATRRLTAPRDATAAGRTEATDWTPRRGTGQRCAGNRLDPRPAGDRLNPGRGAGRWPAGNRGDKQLPAPTNAAACMTPTRPARHRSPRTPPQPTPMTGHTRQHHPRARATETRATRRELHEPAVGRVRGGGTEPGAPPLRRPDAASSGWPPQRAGGYGVRRVSARGFGWGARPRAGEHGLGRGAARGVGRRGVGRRGVGRRTASGG